MARALPTNDRDGCISVLTLGIALDPKLQPQLKMRLTDDWASFTVSTPWVSGEPKALTPWLQKTVALAAVQGVAATVKTVIFEFWSELSTTSDSRVEEFVQLWVKIFAAADCWPQLGEIVGTRPVAVNSSNGVFARRVYEVPKEAHESATLNLRTQSEIRGNLSGINGPPGSGVSERLYEHSQNSQNSGSWLRALHVSENTAAAPTPASGPKQPVPTSALPPAKTQAGRRPADPQQERKQTDWIDQSWSLAKRNELEQLADVVRKYVRTFGAAPDFASDKTTVVEKAYNFIRSTSARPNLSEKELEQIRRMLAKK